MAWTVVREGRQRRAVSSFPLRAREELAGNHSKRNTTKTYLGHDVLELLLDLLLGALEALVEVVADAAALQEHVKGLLGGADLDDALDVLDGAP